MYDPCAQTANFSIDDSLTLMRILHDFYVICRLPDSHLFFIPIMLISFFFLMICITIPVLQIYVLNFLLFCWIGEDFLGSVSLAGRH